jgi:radical SAM protein with 4Fe4S-binding SPASM domain
MAQSKITSSPTFCPAPWTSLNIDQTGRVSPCMHCWDIAHANGVGNIKESPIQEIIHGPILTDMREHMARGEWHSACKLCKQLEETTCVSGRTSTIQHADPETLAAIERDPANYFKLEHMVVSWSNLCNLTCVYCNPETSTAWQSIKGIPINHVKNKHPDLIKLAQEHGHSIVGLTLGGGEPLLQKGLLDFLQCLNSNQVRVWVTTNLSIDITDNPIYNELRTWPNVDWQISFDNADQDKFEYVRNGASWDLFVANIQLMKQHAQKVIAHPAYSIYCAMDLVEYYDFCVAQNLDIFWCELTHPWDLDIRRHSMKLRQQAIAEIDRVVAKYGHQPNLAIDILQRYRMTLLDNSYLNNQDFVPDILTWHQDMETTLKKITRFVNLWPALAKDYNEQ